MFVGKRAEKRKKKKQEGTYGFWDFIGDLFMWVPELLFLPFRLAFLLVRFLIRAIFDAF